MRQFRLITHLAVCFFIATAPSRSRAEEAPNEASTAAPLGVWVAQSMEADGQKVPEEVVKRMRFTFKADKLLIKGNSKKQDDSEQECVYTVDAKQTPMHLDFTPPNQDKPVLAIYEVKDDELKICIRHASSKDGRPEKFETKAGAKLVLFVFKKQKP